MALQIMMTIAHLILIQDKKMPTTTGLVMLVIQLLVLLGQRVMMATPLPLLTNGMMTVTVQEILSDLILMVMGF